MKTKKLILLILFINSFCTQNYKEEDLAKKYYPDGKFVIINNIKIFYRERNQRENKAIVMIHGLGANTTAWDAIMEPLSKKYYTLCFDLPGFGFSEKPDITYSRKFYVDFLDNVLNHFNLSNIILMGNSMGGEIVLRYTIKNPKKVEKLILIDSAGLHQAKERPWFLKLGKVPILNQIPTLLINPVIFPYILSTAYYDYSKISEIKNEIYYYPFKTKNDTKALIDLLTEELIPIPEHELKKIYQPTLILWGKEDKWIPVHNVYRFKKLIPDSKLVIFDKTGHDAQEVIQEKTLEEIFRIDDFLTVPNSMN
ncbi:MAG: alpha/beta hydrolase [Leptospiraceae bacterium]|nr:MAG: alpha/beta hydrolase [Leptospiraceae bacterium]